MVDTSSAENPHDYGLSEEQAQRIATRYRLSPSQFRQQSEQQQHRILTRLRYNDLAQRRAAFFAQFHRGDDGQIAADGFTRAAERLIEMRATEPSGLRGRVAGMSVGRLPTEPQIVPEHVADLAPDNTGWTSLGPGNIGGRIRSILINPVNPQNIYIGSVGGGIWITDDGGQNWRPADDLMANLAVCSLAMVPSNPTTIYAGTGEGYCPDGTKDDEIQGNGIFKTVDGRTWQQLSTTAVTDDNTNFRWVNGIAVNGDVVLAGTRSGIFRSTNGGKLWSSSLSGAVGNILFHPSDSTQCIAGMLFGGGIYYSADGGLTWTRASYPVVPGVTLGRVQVCYAAQSPSNVVYASVEVFESGAAGSQIWQSNDRGRTFTRKNSTTNYLGSQGWYDNIIWAGDPSNANFVIVGGLDLYKSMNGGDTIEPISSGLNVPRSAHYDHHVIRADPRYDGVSNKTVYFGTDGGLYVTSDVKTVGAGPDHTDGWRSLNSKLPITQFYSVSGKFTTSGSKTTITSVVGGSQDNGTLRYTPADGANNWLKWYRGDGGYVASDSPDTNNYYGEYVHLQLFRTTNGGSTAEEIYGEYPTSTGWAWKPAPYFIPDVKDGTAPFIAPFVISPNTPSWLIAGGSSLWRTTNALAQNTPTAGPQWEAIKGPVSGATVSAIAIAAAHNSRMLVGYSNGQIYRTTPDGPPNWERADTGIGANRMCTSLVIDKNDSDRLYATFGGFQANNIWTSANHGSAWSSLGRGLPAAPIYCVTIHPQNPQWLYVGTETGIFASEDGGQTWAPNNEGPTNCLIYQFAWLGNTLCCASHGRGIFAIDLTIRQQASLVLTGDSAGNLTAFNAQAPGGRASSYRIASSQIVAQPLVDGASVYCVYRMPSSPSGLVAKYSTASPLGAPAWQMGLVGAVTATPCLVKATYPGEPDVLYVFTTDGMLWACDAVAGRVLWGAQVMSPAGAVTAYATQAMNQWIYIATDQGLYAVDTQTRAVVLRNTSYVCSAPPLLVSNTVIVPAQNGRVYAVEARTGVEKWTYNSGNVASAPAWIQGSAIVGNQLGQLSGLDYKTGALNFSLLVPNQQIQTVAADGNEFYFVASGTNTTLNAYRLDIATRTLSGKWAVVLSGGSARPLQIVGTSLYLTATNGTLQAFNTGTGASLWQQFLAGVIPSPPALVYA